LITASQATFCATEGRGKRRVCPMDTCASSCRTSAASLSGVWHHRSTNSGFNRMRGRSRHSTYAFPISPRHPTLLTRSSASKPNARAPTSSRMRERQLSGLPSRRAAAAISLGVAMVTEPSKGDDTISPPPCGGGRTSPEYERRREVRYGACEPRIMERVEAVACGEPRKRGHSRVLPALTANGRGQLGGSCEPMNGCEPAQLLHASGERCECPSRAGVRVLPKQREQQASRLAVAGPGGFLDRGARVCIGSFARGASCGTGRRRYVA